MRSDSQGDNRNDGYAEAGADLIAAIVGAERKIGGIQPRSSSVAIVMAGVGRRLEVTGRPVWQ